MRTPEPPWYRQAWGDRYRAPNPDYDPDLPMGPNNPKSVPLSAPAWPSNGGIRNIEAFPDVNRDTYTADENRRFFKANAGGTQSFNIGTCPGTGEPCVLYTSDAVDVRFEECAGGAACELDPDRTLRHGVGEGWIGCVDGYDPWVVFETGGDLGVTGFAVVCDRSILPEEGRGVGEAPTFYDGWVEHDDLPSSKYHRAGDEWLGEITSPHNSSTYGQDLGQYMPGDDPGQSGEILHEDGVIVAGGPYATDVHGNFGFDAGNVLTMELLTWRTAWPFNTGAVWEAALVFEGEDYRRDYHPYAGPSGANLGFRDYNLDGLIDLGETRFAPSADADGMNYTTDSYVYLTNQGIESIYPFNVIRLVEDCIAVLDRLVDFDDYLDTVSLAAHACNFGEPSANIPPSLGTDTITPDAVLSGIVLLPQESYPANSTHFRVDLEARTYYPVHNEDGAFADDTSFPRDRTGAHERIVWNLFAHNVVRVLTDAPGADYDCEAAFAAREYLRTWENFPDLFDYDIFSDWDGTVFNAPIAEFDIMAHIFDRPSVSMVHSVPILKEKPCTKWVKPVDLASILTPGVSTTVTIPSYERVRDRSAYFLENEDRLGERYYFWSSGLGFDAPDAPGNAGLPGRGMVIMHTDVGSNPEALPNGQSHPTRFNYVIVQGDGLGELDAAVEEQDEDGNFLRYADPGDFWPGSEDATEFGRETRPKAAWYTQNSWTGLEITDVREDNYGAVQIEVKWLPTNIPGLSFEDPLGGSSVASRYQVNFLANDVYGGTRIRIYYTDDRNDLSLTHLVGEVAKVTPGWNRLSVNWNVSNVPDGQYYLFAKLIPGSGADGDEVRHTKPRAGRNNVGKGTLTVLNVDINGVSGSPSRSESWTVRCISGQNDEWVVYGTLSQPEPVGGGESPWPHAFTGQTYTSQHGGVQFIIHETKPFVVGDRFVFTTTGITAPSSAVTVTGGEIKENPTAVIVATPLAGLPSLKVDFDGSLSTDPSGQALDFEWDFDDGNAKATGAQVTHTYTRSGTYTVTLRVTNPVNTLFDEASVDIEVINNSPTAHISANPTSGPAPLTVVFKADRSHDSETASQDLIYRWDFDDGSAALAGQFITTQHTYSQDRNGRACTVQQPCTFQPTLTVTDEGGKEDSQTTTIHVGNTAPVVRISYGKLHGAAPQHEVIFNASGSTDVEGHKIEVDWVWGDGQTNAAVPSDTGLTGDGSVPHLYQCAANETTCSFNTKATVCDLVGGKRSVCTEWPGVTVTLSEQGLGVSEPIASFTIDPDPPVLNEPFTADGRYSIDRPDGNPPARFEWDWDDDSDKGTQSVEAHTYTQPGSYTITLIVYDDEDPPNSGRFTRTVQVTSGQVGPGPTTNSRPTAVIDTNTPTGVAGITEFVFDARGSSDPDGDTLTYSWNLGGTRVTGPVVARVFDQPGEYTITLTVTDTSYVSHDATVTIVVRATTDNHPPYAIIGTGPRTGMAPLTLTLNGENSFDPDGDALTFTWEFLHDGELLASPTGATVTYVFYQEGVYSVILEVSDGAGALTRTDPEVIRVTASVGPPDGGSAIVEPPPPVEIPNSGDQRRGGGFCGLGMVMSLFGSLAGLSVMRVSRRRLRL